MSNRHQRRAAPKLPPLPKIPNISGTKEACGNCKFACDLDVAAKVRHIQRMPPTAPDEISCLLNPGGGIFMKDWGWCSHWTAK